MAETYFISDLHFGHKNILKFGQRENNQPLKDIYYIEELWEHQVECINSTITKRDNLWLLGDCFFNQRVFDDYCGRINGSKRMVLGNHDHFDIFRSSKYLHNVYGFVQYKGLWLSHAPIHPDELMGKCNIHGHIHDPYQHIITNNYDLDKRYFNVNIDHRKSFIPTHIDEIRKHYNN